MLPGPFLAGQKLTAGQLNDATQKTIDSVEVGVVGTFYTSDAGGTETNIPQLAMSNIDFVGGALYTFNTRLLAANTSPTSQFVFKIRRDTAVTGTIISDWIIYQPNHSGNGYSFVTWDDISFSTDQSSVDLFASIQRIGAGVETISLTGAVGATNRTGMALRRSGYASEFRTSV